MNSTKKRCGALQIRVLLMHNRQCTTFREHPFDSFLKEKEAVHKLKKLHFLLSMRLSSFQHTSRIQRRVNKWEGRFISITLVRENYLNVYLRFTWELFPRIAEVIIWLHCFRLGFKFSSSPPNDHPRAVTYTSFVFGLYTGCTCHSSMVKRNGSITKDDSESLFKKSQLNRFFFFFRKTFLFLKQKYGLFHAFLIIFQKRMLERQEFESDSIFFLV
jgi:hypothetical protein